MEPAHWKTLVTFPLCKNWGSKLAVIRQFLTQQRNNATLENRWNYNIFTNFSFQNNFDSDFNKKNLKSQVLLKRKIYKSLDLLISPSYTISS